MSTKLNESRMLSAANEINMINDQLREQIISFLHNHSNELFGEPPVYTENKVISPTAPNMEAINKITEMLLLF